MRDRLLVEEQEEVVGVLLPEETDHFRFWVPIFLGDGVELHESSKKGASTFVGGGLLGQETATAFGFFQGFPAGVLRERGGGGKEKLPNI